MIFSAFAQGRAMRARRFPTSRPYCANLGAPREYSPKRAKAGDPMTEYYIPTQAGEAELVEKRSRFIGHVWRVESEEEARARIEEMKKRYYDARHNCWCYLLQGGAGALLGRRGAPGHGGPAHAQRVPAGGGHQRRAVWSPGISGASFWGRAGWSGPILRAPRMPWTPPGISVVRRWVETLVPCPYSLLERLKSGDRRPGAA